MPLFAPRPFLLGLALACAGLNAAADPSPTLFRMVSHIATPGVAEIVAASPDGLTLFYTSADAGRLGVVDIRDPARPVQRPSVDVRLHGVGEPTSVAITPDGRFAVVAVRLEDDRHNARRGLLRIYAIGKPGAVRHVRDISVGIGPDSVALAGRGRTLRAVVAIEDEETDASGDATLGGQRPGAIDVVGLESLYGGRDSGLQRLTLVDALRNLPGAVYPEDPQPEFVAIDPVRQRAAVTLQENNAVAIVDLSNPRRARLERVFSAGTVSRQGNADLQRDKDVRFADRFTGRREPDGVAWVAPGLLATANEGDGKKSADGVLPGGRGFTLLDDQGQVVFESMDAVERHAAQYGHYPDTRSAAKGVEVESVASARFGGATYLLAGSERGSFVDVWRMGQDGKPQWVQLLPTGLSPEGLTTVTHRKDGQALVVTANEGDGSLNLFRFDSDASRKASAEPVLRSTGADLPWGAISGLTSDGQYLYAVPDNAFAPSRVWRINLAEAGQGRWLIDRSLPITTADGKALSLDPEGIARVPGGFWIASEGATVDGNELLRIDEQGVVQQRVKLPAAIQAAFSSPKVSTGYEGVAASADGQTLYLAVQRGFDPARPQAAILRYDLPTQTWTTALYPLDAHSKDPKQFWTGISEIQLTADGRLLLLERDKGGGEGRAVNAEIKRVYSVAANSIHEGAVLRKTLVRDLRRDHHYLHEKAEGMVVHDGRLWVVNDNDGAGWTRVLDAGRP